MTSKVAEKLRKKRGFPVQHDGETYYVRELTMGELARFDKLPKETKTGFLVGCALVEDAGGAPVFPKQPDEGDEAYAVRMMAELAEVTPGTLRALSEGVASISKAVKVENVLKNSCATTTSGSP